KSSLVRFACRSCFRRSWTRGDSAFAAVECDAGLVVHHDCTINIDVGYVDGIHAHDGSVVEESSAAPLPPEEADAAITEAVVNATVKTDVRAPVTGMPEVKAAAPSPVARSPQHADRCDHPGTGHPVV